MSDWYWRVMALKAAFVLTCFASYLRADDNVQKLPFCNPHSADSLPGLDDLILVSTLDGKLTAFSTNDGNKAWDVQTQPLLSSNLHHVELTSGGKWVRLVPSLRGTLYSLSGDTVEPLPFTAEQLLSSSFKYSNDLVIAGTKESLWLGIDVSTGMVVYECGGAGCGGGERGAGGPLLAVRRRASTVRALDPATGEEKWNFSVAEHSLAMPGRDCASPGKASPLEYTVRVAPEGGVAVSTAGERTVLWQQHLASPVAAMWRLAGGSLQAVDVLWAASRALTADPHLVSTPPSLYIGLHNQQLYIQEGQQYVQKMDTAVSSKPLPWRLKNTRPLINGPDEASALQNADPNTLSLITLYGNTGQGNRGFFLYQEETCDQSVQVSEQELVREGVEVVPPPGAGPAGAGAGAGAGGHQHVHVHVYSLWYWWKEVLLIAISSTLLMNLMIWPRFFAPKFRPISPLPVNKEYIVVEKHYDRPASNPEYSGRYETDFTPLRCLGRGGFGVVFEARNNIDHCSYAVKRITLPRRESKRERVLREVRALAKLEHEHIVRYFNAWLEEPPAARQRARDLHWERDLEGVSLAMTEDCTSASRAPPAQRLRSRSCNDSFSIVFDENAKEVLTAKTISSIKNSLDLTTTPLSPDFSLAKNLGSGDNDDSFIVFANTEDLNHNSKGVSEMEVSNKQLERVRKSDDFSKPQSGPSRKKKGHTRHWSLDMCVKSSADSAPPPDNKMYLYIQMQLCLRDSLHDWLRQNRTMESRKDKVVTLFSQIVSAVEYVHLAGLIHRDLKPSNIFFAPDGKVKVGDFGLVTAMNDHSQDGEEPPPPGLRAHTRHTYKVGTQLYMSPEQARGRPYSYKVDVFSLGLLLLELLQPFATEAERVRALLAARARRLPPALALEHPQETEVLKLMLSEDPSLRPTASGVRARAPLYEPTDERYHFVLPHNSSSN